MKEQKQISQKMLEYAFLDFFGEPLEWDKIVREETGKPVYVLEGHFFNISHCGNGVAVAVARAPVGVDIEGERKVKVLTVKKCMDEREKMYIGSQDGEWLEGRQIQRFLNLWTLKESYVKMTGAGIRVPFHEICFDISDFPKDFAGDEEMFFVHSRVLKPWKKNSVSCLLSKPNQSLALTLGQKEDIWPRICPRELKNLTW